jgi:hypothetical protein
VIGARALALAALLGSGCAVGVGVGYDTEYPSDTYIATTVPYYYGGYPTYWYGGHWYYRDGAHWRHYEQEPQALHDYRAHAAPGRHNFEPTWRGYAGRPPGSWHR